MTLTSNHLKTITIELGAPENPKLDTKIINPACLGTEIQIVQFRGNPYPKEPPKYYFYGQPRMAPRLTLIRGL